MKDDTFLLTLGQLFSNARKQEEETYQAVASLPSDSDLAEALSDAAFKHVAAIVKQILACDAVSVGGLRIKAEAIAWCRSDEPFDADSREPLTTDMKLVSSILNDLMQMPVEAKIAA